MIELWEASRYLVLRVDDGGLSRGWMLGRAKRGCAGAVVKMGWQASSWVCQLDPRV